MRIIKHGNPNKGEIQFDCPWCGCSFVACREEYDVYSVQREFKTWAAITCPDCKGRVKKDLTHSPSAY